MKTASSTGTIRRSVAPAGISLAVVLTLAAGCDHATTSEAVVGTTARVETPLQASQMANAETSPKPLFDPLPTFSAERLEQLVAPVALYPDPLLMEILMAATYPAEVAEAGAWRKQNAGLNGKELDAAIADLGWDVSVNSLTHAPQALNLMAADPAWTQDLGDAFLGQQDDVLNAVQVLRSRAYDLGNLRTTDQQQVIVDETVASPPSPGASVQVVVESPTRIVRIVPAQPDVIYVPVYNPQVIYGPPPPTVYYPEVVYYPTIRANVTPIITFGVGLAIGAILAGDCDWHHGRVYSRRYGGGYYGGGYYDRYRDRYRDGYRDGRRDGYYDGHRRHDEYSSRAKLWRHDSSHRRDVRYRTERVARTYRPSLREGERSGRQGDHRSRDRMTDARDRVGRGTFAGPRGGTRDGSHDSESASPRDPRERAREEARERIRNDARDRIRRTDGEGSRRADGGRPRRAGAEGIQESIRRTAHERGSFGATGADQARRPSADSRDHRGQVREAERERMRNVARERIRNARTPGRSGAEVRTRPGAAPSRASARPSSPLARRDHERDRGRDTRSETGRTFRSSPGPRPSVSSARRPPSGNRAAAPSVQRREASSRSSGSNRKDSFARGGRSPSTHGGHVERGMRGRNSGAVQSSSRGGGPRNGNSSSRQRSWQGGQAQASGGRGRR